VSKSYRAAPEWGRLSKPRHEPTIEEELEEMDSEEIYIVRNEDQLIGAPTSIEEDLAFHRTRQGAWQTLYNIAEGQGVELRPGDTSFDIGPTRHYEFRGWYITTGILED
jgi:hypothetical protein